MANLQALTQPKIFDRQALRAHPGYGAGLLERMEGWEPAAEMVAQHHEMPDGAGYPEGLKSDAICPGAKILAIVDAFEAMMLKHTHRGHGRSMLRAIVEVKPATTSSRRSGSGRSMRSSTA